MDIKNLTIVSAHESMKNGDFTASELLEEYLREIKENNEELNAIIEVYKDDAVAQAKDADNMFKDGTATYLTGIPIVTKDNILIKGKPATAASNILKGHIATYEGMAIKNLKEKGAVLIGRANMDDAAMGSSTQSSCYGPTKNPLDKTRVPGGSSGGSTASVAGNMALGALGSDTAGSIRQPASFCGLVGLKPTYGSVSRNGLIALGSSLDVIGPIAKTVGDVEIIFEAIKGKDKLDSTSVSDDMYEKKEIKKPVIGVLDIEELAGIGAKITSLDNFDAAVARLKTLGYETKKISLPNIKYSVPAYYVILPAEASTNLARFDGVKYGLHIEGEDLLEDYMISRGKGFGDEVRRRIMIGTYVLSAGYHDAYYNKAQAVRKLITEDFTNAFKDVDVIVTPTTPGTAFKLGEKIDDPVSMYLEDIFTVPANLSGIPAITLPSGFVEEDGSNLPLGLQIMAPHMREDLLFTIGKDFLGE